MLHSALNAFTDAIHDTPAPAESRREAGRVGESGLCHSDDECVLWFSFCSHSSFVDGGVIYLYVGRSVLCGALARVQDYRIVETDPTTIASRVSRPVSRPRADPDTTESRRL